VGETKFAELGRDRVAYQVLGDGPDLVLLTGTLSHVDVRWGDPQHAQFLRRLASFSRLILLDPRGCGASDPIPLDPLPTWEDEADDLGAVLDAVGSSQATVFASSDAGPPALFYAATHPERVRALILANTTARYAWAEDYPIGLRAEEIDRSMERLRELWGTEACVELIAPSQSGDPEFCRWLARW
jgi:pimeloyl-ACP methyl ester carboxylesterase